MMSKRARLTCERCTPVPTALTPPTRKEEETCEEPRTWFLRLRSCSPPPAIASGKQPCFSSSSPSSQPEQFVASWCLSSHSYKLTTLDTISCRRVARTHWLHARLHAICAIVPCLIRKLNGVL